MATLTFKYGQLQTLAKGTQIDGDDTTPLSEGDYVIKTIAGTSGLPTGSVVGYPLTVLSGVTITPKTGDAVIPLTASDQCDIQNATVEFTKDEIEVTTLCDNDGGVKVYQDGLADASGSLEGIYKTAITDIDGGFLNKLLNIARLSADGTTYTLDAVDTDPVYLKTDLNKTASADTPLTYLLAPVKILSFNLGLTQGEAQTFTASYKITTDDDINTSLYAGSTT